MLTVQIVRSFALPQHVNAGNCLYATGLLYIGDSERVLEKQVASGFAF